MEQLESILVMIASPTGGLFAPATFDTGKDQTDAAVGKATSTDPTINGDFVIVWEHEVNSPTNLGNTDIRGRLYDANGQPKGADFAIANTFLDEQNPRVSMAADGSFIVTYEQKTEVNGDFDVAYRRFSASGTPLDPPGTLVHPASSDEQTLPDVAAFANGDFVIVWEETIANNTDILFRRYNANGTAIDNNPRKLADNSRDEFLPRVAATKSTTVNQYTFTVTYTFDDPSGQLDIYRDLRRFSNGNTISGRIVVTDDDDVQDLDQVRSSVSMDATGRAVITWSQETSNGNFDIFYKRFEDDGDPLDPNLRRVVDNNGSRNTNHHEVSMSNEGLFIVVFEIANGFSNTVDVRFRTFDFDIPDQPGRTVLPIDPAAVNNLEGGPTAVLEPSSQNRPVVAMNGTGEFTIAWDDDFVFPIARQQIVARNYRNTVETAGVYQPTSALYFLRNSNTTGVADITFPFGIVTSNPTQRWIPFEGDFDGNGIATVGVYDPVRALYYLRNSNTTGAPVADLGPINFGIPNWIPIFGDWDGDGVQTIGAYNPSQGRFFLRNTNTTGVADVSFRFGPTSGHLPVVGDWDGDGIDTVGVYNTSTGRFQLTNDAAPPSGTASQALQFVLNPAGKPVSGDFNRSGKDSVGVYLPASSQFRLVANLPNNNGTPVVTTTFVYGAAQNPSWVPIMGDWDGPGADPLLASEEQTAPRADVATLDPKLLECVMPEYIAPWVKNGISQETLRSVLSFTNIAVQDLGPGLLGMTADGVITLDDDANGYGWFIDPTPGESEEFTWVDGQLQALAGGPADGRYDLLTVLAHEFGHLLGYEDLDDATAGENLMSESLGLGTRRLPAAAVDQLLSGRAT